MVLSLFSGLLAPRAVCAVDASVLPRGWERGKRPGKRRLPRPPQPPAHSHAQPKKRRGGR